MSEFKQLIEKEEILTKKALTFMKNFAATPENKKTLANISREIIMIRHKINTYPTLHRNASSRLH